MEHQATYPDQPGVRPLTIEQVAEIVKGRIQTAFGPIEGHAEARIIGEAEVRHKAEWVVNGIDKWGETDS